MRTFGRQIRRTILGLHAEGEEEEVGEQNSSDQSCDTCDDDEGIAIPAVFGSFRGMRVVC